MKVKKKVCAGCQQEKQIWASEGRNKYCKDCWQRRPANKNADTSKRQPISKRSERKEKEDLEYSKLREAFLLNKSFCQLRLPGCTGMATDVHHTEGRGIYYLDTTTWKAGCRTCHDIVTVYSAQAIELELSKSRHKKAA